MSPSTFHHAGDHRVDAVPDSLQVYPHHRRHVAADSGNGRRLVADSGIGDQQIDRPELRFEESNLSGQLRRVGDVGQFPGETLTGDLLRQSLHAFAPVIDANDGDALREQIAHELAAQPAARSRDQRGSNIRESSH